MKQNDDKTALIWGRQRIGDVVMSIPALKILRKHAPRLKTRYVTTFYASELVRLTGLVDDVRCVRLKGGIRNFFRWWKLRREVSRGEYAPIFLLGKVSRYERKVGGVDQTVCIKDFPDGHTAERCANTIMAGLGLSEVDVPSPEVHIPDQPAITKKLDSFGLPARAHYLVVHSGCNRVLRGSGGAEGSEKLWPTEKYPPLFRRLREAHPELKLVLVGTESERPWIRRHLVEKLPPEVEPINLAGYTSIRETLQLLRHASALLCGDSGVMHLATMTGTPMVALFGPTDENSTGPFGVDQIALRIRAVPLEDAEKDPQCMDKISVEEVYHGLEEQLALAQA